jgi:hypothetical protein
VCRQGRKEGRIWPRPLVPSWAEERWCLHLFLEPGSTKTTPSIGAYGERAPSRDARRLQRRNSLPPMSGGSSPSRPPIPDVRVPLSLTHLRSLPLPPAMLKRKEGLPPSPRQPVTKTGVTSSRKPCKCCQIRREALTQLAPQRHRDPKITVKEVFPWKQRLRPLQRT